MRIVHRVFCDGAAQVQETELEKALEYIAGQSDQRKQRMRLTDTLNQVSLQAVR